MQGLCAISSSFSQKKRAIFAIKNEKNFLTKQHDFSILFALKNSLRRKRGGSFEKYEKWFFPLTFFCFSDIIKTVYHNTAFGAVMVSTGTLRYDKRSGQEDPVKPSDLNNKRQQQSCCSGVSRVAAICRPYRRRGLRLRPCVKSVVNMHRKFALVPIMQKRATRDESLSLGAFRGE